jgi:hypothetical protein
MASIKLTSFPVVEKAECPKCHLEVVLFDPEGSEFCVCTACNTFIRFIAEDHGVAQRGAPEIEDAPIIPLGSEGLLKDHQFKVIAYLEKKESGTTYTWKEYILYNFEKGYVTLAEFDGHWNYVVGKNFFTNLEALPDNKWGFIEYEGNQYTVYNKYTAVVTALIGEFDWNVLEEKIKVVEFVAAPYIIFKESNKEDLNQSDFYLGEYISTKEIATAFNIAFSDFPEIRGIGANQPSTHFERWSAVLRLTPVLFLVVLLIQLATGYLRPEVELLNGDYSISHDSLKAGNEFKPFNTPSFEIKERPSSLEFNLSSAVDNNWLEATVVLLNETTNQSWEITEGIEYYHGVEDGESWTEGSQGAEILLSEIPPGKYHLNVYPASGDLSISNLNIKVIANPTLWRNIIVTLLVLLLYPIYCWYRMRNFEKNRWMNSDFSPFDTE